MQKSTVRALAGAAFLACGLVGAAAEVAKPSPVDILFDRKHLANVEAGQALVYTFERKVSSAELLGQPFSDEIKVEIKKADPNGLRDVLVKVFTGERARDPYPIDGLTGNPVLVVLLDRAVSSYMSVAGGKIPYLKDKFRSAIRERATVEPVRVSFAGKTVDAQRISLQPYAGDLNAQKMRGFENSKFAFVVSEAVPGQFVEMTAVYESSDKVAPRLEERTLLKGAKVIP